jgi:hypothetical protein
MVFGKLFGPSCTIALTLSDTESRKTVTLPKDPADDPSGGANETMYVYTGADAIAGSVTLTPTKKVEHAGIRIEVVGQIILTGERTEKFDFVSVSRELAPAGDLTTPVTFNFDFQAVEKPYESYRGLNARLRYMVRCLLIRNYASNMVQEQEIWVRHTEIVAPLINPGIKMEVGIEDSLHIEFEYERSKMRLKDCVVGKVYFLLVKIRIKHMEIALIRRETIGSGASMYQESETITRFEIMDGAPVRGESIPVRMFLGAYPLTPTYSNVNNKFAVKYYLNLFIIDDEDRRYFKQVEVILYRSPEDDQ